jgi:hypothetical protein
LVARWPLPADLRAPDVGAVAQYGPVDTCMLALVSRYRYGLVRYNSQGGVSLAWLIAEIALAFPMARIAIVVDSKDFGYQLQRQLSRFLNVTMVTRRPSEQPAGRVVVGTPAGLAGNTVAFPKRDIVILPRAWDALHYYAETALMAADSRFRLFGLLPTNRTLSPYEEDRIRATFGFAEVTVWKHGLVERFIRSFWKPIRGGPSIPSRLSVLQLKRRGIWYHPVRNRWIARIVRGLSCPCVEPQVCTSAGILHSLPAAFGVMVVVEGVEHALALAKLLPGSALVVGDVILQGLSGSDRRLLARRRALATAGRPVIATVAGLARPNAVDWSTLRIVIWAGAGPGLPPIPADHLVCRPAENRAVLFVDFDDLHHPQLHCWSRSRQEAYLDAAWIAPDADPVQVRVERFLAQRPDVENPT